VFAGNDVSAADAPHAPIVSELGVSRGRILPALYITAAGLQAYDGWSTVTGLRRGATEANAGIAGLASHPGAIWAFKAGAAIVSVSAAEVLWRRHRRAEAIATMVAVNSIMVAVALNNASVIRRLR
jgi:hypothetical protein